MNAICTPTRKAIILFERRAFFISPRSLFVVCAERRVEQCLRQSMAACQTVAIKTHHWERFSVLVLLFLLIMKLIQTMDRVSRLIRIRLHFVSAARLFCYLAHIKSQLVIVSIWAGVVWREGSRLRIAVIDFGMRMREKKTPAHGRTKKCQQIRVENCVAQKLVNISPSESAAVDALIHHPNNGRWMRSACKLSGWLFCLWTLSGRYRAAIATF